MCSESMVYRTERFRLEKVTCGKRGVCGEHCELAVLVCSNREKTVPVSKTCHFAMVLFQILSKKMLNVFYCRR